MRQFREAEVNTSSPKAAFVDLSALGDQSPVNFDLVAPYRRPAATLAGSTVKSSRTRSPRGQLRARPVSRGTGAVAWVPRGGPCRIAGDGGGWVMTLPLNDDVAAIASGANWVLPALLGAHRGHPVYRYRAKPRRADAGSFVNMPKDIAADTGEAEPSRYGHPDAGIDLPLVPHHDGAPPLPPPEVFGWKPAGGEWVTLHAQNVEFGVVYTGKDADSLVPTAQLGPWALAIESDYTVAVLRHVSAGAAKGSIGDVQKRCSSGGDTPRAADDARVLPILRYSADERVVLFPAHVARLRQEEFEDRCWPLVGPRTVGHCMREVAEIGAGCIARAKEYKHENNLKDDEHAWATVEIISEALELFNTIGQLDTINLCGCEAMVGWQQYIGYGMQREKGRKKANDGSSYFLSRFLSAGGRIAAPDLLRFVSEGAGEDAGVMKELRKAQEEQAPPKKRVALQRPFFVPHILVLVVSVPRAVPRDLLLPPYDAFDGCRPRRRLGRATRQRLSRDSQCRHRMNEVIGAIDPSFGGSFSRSGVPAAQLQSFEVHRSCSLD